eukprot:IDg18161t1
MMFVCQRFDRVAKKKGACKVCGLRIYCLWKDLKHKGTHLDANTRHRRAQIPEIEDKLQEPGILLGSILTPILFANTTVTPNPSSNAAEVIMKDSSCQKRLYHILELVVDDPKRHDNKQPSR